MDNLEYQVQKIADSLLSLGRIVEPIRDISDNTTSLKKDLYLIKEQNATLFEEIRKVRKIEAGKYVNDTVMKIMELKQKFNRKEISKDDFVLCLNAMVENVDSLLANSISVKRKIASIVEGINKSLKITNEEKTNLNVD